MLRNCTTRLLTQQISPFALINFTFLFGSKTLTLVWHKNFQYKKQAVMYTYKDCSASTYSWDETSSPDFLKHILSADFFLYSSLSKWSTDTPKSYVYIYQPHKNETPCSIKNPLFNHFQYTEMNCTEESWKGGGGGKQVSSAEGITFSPRILSENSLRKTAFPRRNNTNSETTKRKL